MELTKRQKNDVYDALMEGGLDPSQCDGPVNVFGQIEIRHPNTNSVIRAMSDGKDHYMGERQVAGVLRDHFLRCDWPLLLQQIGRWAEEVEYEATAPDFWEELKTGKELLATVRAESTNDPFTSEEQVEIARHRSSRQL